jgi:iron complex transport system permease protein
LKNKNFISFTALSVLCLLLFVADLIFGNISISLRDIFSVFSGSGSNATHTEILLNYRLPKSLTAILTGSALSVAGLLMQTFFRNPLADPYILGISSGAGLGVALITMSGSFIPIFFIDSGWAFIFSAVFGALLILLLVIGASFKVKDTVSLLIVGIMFGTISSSLISVLQSHANPDTLKLYIIWTFGSLSAVTWDYMQVLFPVTFTGLLLAFYLQKDLDGLLLGENYARGLGISINRTRFLIILSTGLLAGSITAFTGPIAFVGVAVPHLSRGLFRSSSHHILLPACLLLGSSLLLICDIITLIPVQALPINVVSSLIGAPVIIWIIIKRRKY